MTERTLVLVKPDGVARGLTGQILDRIERKGYRLVALELRMGVKRELALRNFAMRTNVDDISSFVSMLVQSDRFGTNVAEALRVQAETMRVHRRLRAEERAAKIPLKLLFPLIFFIFPSLMLVLMGPAMISIYRVLLPTMGGNG